jgi:hypothetical protein
MVCGGRAVTLGNLAERRGADGGGVRGVDDVGDLGAQGRGGD